MAPTVEDRFFAKVQTAEWDACWHWTASKKANGYGQFGVRHGESPALSHRWAWEFFRGPIPDGLTIDHLCRNRGCVNPEHLEPVPQALNARRASGWAVGRCRSGHDLTAPGAVIEYETQRYCRACRRKSWARANVRGVNS